ncbi:hypothetical protein H0H92_007102 [Tricholoma furcatifolium]|nr:hypothetical protein H0H92_007102 [Tricholoma furcatifolium]
MSLLTRFSFTKLFLRSQRIPRLIIRTTSGRVTCNDITTYLDRHENANDTDVGMVPSTHDVLPHLEPSQAQTPPTTTKRERETDWDWGREQRDTPKAQRGNGKSRRCGDRCVRIRKGLLRTGPVVSVVQLPPSFPTLPSTSSQTRQPHHSHNDITISPPTNEKTPLPAPPKSVTYKLLSPPSRSRAPPQPSPDRRHPKTALPSPANKAHATEKATPMHTLNIPTPQTGVRELWQTTPPSSTSLRGYE